jgi:hypothetical protein
MKDESSPSTLYFSDHRHKNGDPFIDFDAKLLDPSRFYRACIRQQLQPRSSFILHPFSVRQHTDATIENWQPNGQG